MFFLQHRNLKVCLNIYIAEILLKTFYHENIYLQMTEILETNEFLQITKTSFQKFMH